MRALYIIGEGQTEEEFVNSILSPYFAQFNIYDVRCILMSTSKGHKGGAVTYQRYKSNVETLLKQQKDIFVSSLIDFYKLHTDFPSYQEAISKHPIDKIQRVEFLENAITQDIKNSRFLPYIQLHEIESLLFSSTMGFDSLPDISKSNLKLLKNAVEKYDNPELLNDGQDTSPSKRLKKLIPGYQKTLHGPLLANTISLNTIMSKCERFNSWLNMLVTKVNT